MTDTMTSQNIDFSSWDTLYIFDHISLISYKNEIFQTEAVDKIETQRYLFSSLFRIRCRFGGNVENIVGRSRQQMTVWRMRIACWYLRLQKHTLSNNDYTNAPQCYIYT